MALETQHRNQIGHVDQTQFARDCADRIRDDLFLLGGKWILLHDRTSGVLEFGLVE